MSDFRPMTECKGFNMERVLLKNKNGYMITAYFKDGMLQCDGDEDWTRPIAWDSFIRLKDLANGSNTSDSGLHLQRISGSFNSVECKDLMYYGTLKDGSVKIDDGTKHLDYFLLNIFDLAKESTRFNVKEAIKTFWDRVEALANYR